MTTRNLARRLERLEGRLLPATENMIGSLLLGAGAIIAPADIPSGDAVVDAILREHGLL